MIGAPTGIGNVIQHEVSHRARMGNRYLAFFLDEQRYALHLSIVEMVARMVHITPLPDAPGIVRGVVNVRGKVVPVVNLRQRFNLPKREILLTDWLIFANTERRLVGLIADAVIGVVECPEDCVIPTDMILPATKYLEGVIKFEDGLVLIQNLGEFLSLEEEKSLDVALGTT
jgi:purine-binding chemotaxis protein CheW